MGLFWSLSGLPTQKQSSKTCSPWKTGSRYNFLTVENSQRTIFRDIESLSQRRLGQRHIWAFRSTSRNGQTLLRARFWRIEPKCCRLCLICTPFRYKGNTVYENSRLGKVFERSVFRHFFNNNCVPLVSRTFLVFQEVFFWMWTFQFLWSFLLSQRGYMLTQLYK